MDTKKSQHEHVSRIDRVGTWSETEGLINVIVDTPKGSANKYQLDVELGIFKFGGVLTADHSFPFGAAESIVQQGVEAAK